MKAAPHGATEEMVSLMRTRYLATLVLLAALTVGRMDASQRYIVRNNNGLLGMQLVCKLIGCNVLETLDGSLGKVFLVVAPDRLPLAPFLTRLLSAAGIVNIELDRRISMTGPRATSAIPNWIWDRAPFNLAGTTVWSGYANQPASHIIRLGEARASLRVTGQGIVGIIDTGVDAHPALGNTIVPGYDFVNGKPGPASETGNVQQSTAAVLDGGPAFINQSTAAVLDDTLLRALGLQGAAAVGHGTMVAGIVHMVAPTAKIMSLRAFDSDGAGYLSDILSAIYWGSQHSAKVLNMSFSLAESSQELQRAVDDATARGVICVASAGNNGQELAVYPAGLSNVIGVGSTDNADRRSSFSNYGSAGVWVAAPGEGIMTTFPYLTYSVGWGTSFSAPMVSGTAALLAEVSSRCNQHCAAEAVAHAVKVDPDLGHGRLDVYRSVQFLRNKLGVF